MPQDTPQSTPQPIWTGKPWILPSAVIRTLVVLIVAIAASWVELFVFDFAFTGFMGLSILIWTVIVFFIIWIISLMHLLLLRASNTYILRSDSLEVRHGILSSKSFMLSASGFSDLEVIRSVSGRIVGMGDMIVRTQGERDVTMVMVRHPQDVGEKIRQVMARPIVRIERPAPEEEEKK